MLLLRGGANSPDASETSSATEPEAYSQPVTTALLNHTGQGTLKCKVPASRANQFQIHEVVLLALIRFRFSDCEVKTTTKIPVQKINVLVLAINTERNTVEKRADCTQKIVADWKRRINIQVIPNPSNEA